MEKLIICDVDGVLLDWVKSFNKYMKNLGYKPVNKSEYAIDKYFGIDRKESKKLVCDFNKSDEMYFLKPLRDSFKYISKFKELGYSIDIITSQTNDRIAKMKRVMNLKEVFGEGTFRNIIIMGCGEDKDRALNLYKDSGAWWIEDKPENADAGIKYGLKSILMKHDHNENYLHEDIPLANNWKEIFEIVEK
jgi:FMN phosphatase YigB (HAD superfamily)